MRRSLVVIGAVWLLLSCPPVEGKEAPRSGTEVSCSLGSRIMV